MNASHLLLTASLFATSDTAAARHVELALACIHKEYPNKISHVLAGDEHVLAPRQLYPVFHGCLDWHSAVHGHWMLVRLLRLHPQAEFAQRVQTALEQSFQAEKVAGEVRYFSQGEYRESFERPYGLAWFLQLMAELRDWDDPRAQQWQAVLEPLEEVVAARLERWLPKLSYPIRTGEHSQTMFAFGLVLDWARTAWRHDLAEMLVARSRQYHLADRDCPLAYEPSGQDFLSPCLAEADLMRRILDPPAYGRWLAQFMPQIPEDGSADWLELVVVTDKSDGKLAHLDGLNLSRAWMLEGIASGLPQDDPRRPAILAAAGRLGEAGLAAVTGEDYAGGHWLASFATYLTTRRGLDTAPTADDKN